MNKPIVFLILRIFFSCTWQSDEQVAEKIIALELDALEKWGKGDPSGFLELSAPDVVYFDPMMEKRLDGHEALSKLYESLRGQIHVDSIQMPNPKVQAGKELAVLTFNLVSWSGGTCHRWNCTEVYRMDNKEWKIIQTHWSLTQPELKQAPE